jgi:3-oxoacyl-[acyl-carrier protein] reductase
VLNLDLDLKNKVAIITASSSGLGRGAAQSLLREGARVVINGRNKTKLQAALNELKQLSAGEIIAVPGDLTKKEDLKNLVQETINRFGQLDYLVTSAGGPPAGQFIDLTESDWYQAFDLLVMSVVRLVKYALPYLKESDQAAIVNITSTSVKEALPNLLLSNSVRMGVIGLMKTLANELAPQIRVNAVLPGSHETARIKELLNNEVENGQFKDYQAALVEKSRSIPLQRLGQPTEIGDLITFLLSPRAAYLTGETIVIDGGSTSSNL